MDKRLILVGLIALLFWLAPKPNASQANQGSSAQPAREISPNDRIVITRFIKPDHAK